MLLYDSILHDSITIWYYTVHRVLHNTTVCYTVKNLGGRKAAVPSLLRACVLSTSQNSVWRRDSHERGHVIGGGTQAADFYIGKIQ